ncbi:MAG: glycogen/starch synthase [Treponema sp.]|nr:glycogen/starch synthase [Treponema sp.]
MPMKLWIVSMECAGIAEAGGVKNVTFSLCKEFAELKHKVTLFVPIFKCNSWNLVENFEKAAEAQVELCGKKENVRFYKATCRDGDFSIVFVNHKSFYQKEAIYTYTEHEQQQNPEHKKGEGHKDLLFKDVLFQKAVFEYGKRIPRSEVAEIIHCQDASTAMIPAFIQEAKCYSKTKCVVTIHNAGPYYHHDFTSIGEAAWHTGLSSELLEASLNKKCVEPFLIAANCGAELTTVSEKYAQELLDPFNTEATDGLSPLFAEKKVKITGITNGFDFDRYNPEDKQASLLPFEFAPEKNELDGKLKCRKFFIQNIVNTDNFDCTGVKKFGKLECSPSYTKEIFISYHGRITSQKGLTVLTKAIPAIISNFDNVRFVIAGQGEPSLEDEIILLTQKYKGKITFMNGYNRVIARLTSAICDFIVLPSYFEPCGLEDFIAQVYGTIPVAHATGGLTKIEDGKTGFLYSNNTHECLIAKLTEVIMLFNLKHAVINKIIKAGAQSVHKEFYWKNIVKNKYLPFFKEILKK